MFCILGFFTFFLIKGPHGVSPALREQGVWGGVEEHGLKTFCGQIRGQKMYSKNLVKKT